MSPVIKALDDKGLGYFILHTGQHYSYNMDRVFFEQLRLPKPKYNLNVGSGTHGEETGRMIMGIEGVLQREQPNVVLVEGDTNSVLSGALAAVKLGIKVGHIEAGLRSFDRSMPEEINRIVADLVSDHLFAPTEGAKQNLSREGVGEEKIHVTGNTIVDAIHQNLGLAKDRSEDPDIREGNNGYFLATLHRQENVDNPERLKNILEGLALVSERLERDIIYPIHPRTRERLQDFNIRLTNERIKVIDPMDYLSFLRFESGADLIFTDSGGVQEEACILNVPCVTLRQSTERPETIKVGANVLAGSDPEKMLKCAEAMLKRNRGWKNPFGDGKAGGKIVGILEDLYTDKSKDETG